MAEQLAMLSDNAPSRCKNGCGRHLSKRNQSGYCNRCWERYPKCRRTWHRARYAAIAKVREDSAERSRRYRYGLEKGDYAKLIKAQGGRCKICMTDRPPRARGGREAWHVDHDRVVETLEGRVIVRGLLCSSCNSSMRGYDRMRLQGREEAAVRCLLYAAKSGSIEMPWMK